MAGIESKTFDKADEVRQFGHGHMDVVNLNDRVVGRSVFEPGWKWSNDVKPIAGTDSCQVEHLGYVVSGRMHVKMNDGTEVEAEEGDMFHIEPGHDAWIVGDETCVVIDVQGSANYAVKK